MGRHPSFVFGVASTFNPTGRRGSVPSWVHLHGRSTNRKPFPTSSIKMGTQTIPRSLVLSFYSILRGSPIFVCGESLQQRKQLLPSMSSRHSRCWQLEHLLSSRWTITTPAASFQYPGLSKRRFNSDVSSPEPQSLRPRTRASNDSLDTKVDKCG